jgi:hypothetical protein
MIETTAPGTIIVIAVRDDASEKLSVSAKEAIESLGSKEIRKLGYRDSWCFVGRKGASMIEKYAPSRSGPVALREEKKALLVLPELSSAMTPKSPLAYRAVKLPTAGKWLRRRKIDGALQRSPPLFYAKIYRLLEISKHGLNIGGNVLPRDPTVSEKTPEEVNFALYVEDWLNKIQDPVERQIDVECLMVIHEIEMRNPSSNLVSNIGKLDISKIVDEACRLHWSGWVAESGFATSSDANKPTAADAEKAHPFDRHSEQARLLFFDLPREGDSGTMNYLVRACLKMIPNASFSVSEFTSIVMTPQGRHAQLDADAEGQACLPLDVFAKQNGDCRQM